MTRSTVATLSPAFSAICLMVMRRFIATFFTARTRSRIRSVFLQGGSDAPSAIGLPAFGFKEATHPLCVWITFHGRNPLPLLSRKASTRAEAHRNHPPLGKCHTKKFLQYLIDHYPNMDSLISMKPQTDDWYRPPIPRKELKQFMQRSDAKGLANFALWFASLCASGLLAYKARRSFWAIPAFLLYGNI
jgi:hypothetical protein